MIHDEHENNGRRVIDLTGWNLVDTSVDDQPDCLACGCSPCRCPDNLDFEDQPFSLQDQIDMGIDEEDEHIFYRK